MYGCSPARAEGPIRIAIIDTGVNKAQTNAPICDYGMSYTTVPEEDATDFDGHGTEVANVIDHYMPKVAKYCVIPFKIFDKKLGSSNDSVARAINTAITLKADIINLSISTDYYVTSEKLAIKRALDAGVILVIAAGNNGRSLDAKCNLYPACYDKRAIVVGYHGTMSNTGKIVDYIESGWAVKMYKTGPNGEKLYRQGSSFAAPRIVTRVASNLQTFKTRAKGGL